MLEPTLGALASWIVEVSTEHSPKLLTELLQGFTLFAKVTGDDEFVLMLEPRSR